MAQNAAPARELPLSNFSDRISECKTNYDILRLVRELVQAHRFGHFLIARLPEPGESKITAISIVSNWPSEMVAAFDENGLLAKSPEIHASRKSTRPYIWRAGESDSQSPVLSDNDYVDLFARFGIKMSVTIPVQQASGQRGIVSLSGNRETPSEAELMEISYYANLVYAQIAEIGDTGSGLENLLSARERECLQWTSSGKTSQEIATILKLSEHTVNHYLSAACHKLGATNRAHAVAKAIRAGLLD